MEQTTKIDPAIEAKLRDPAYAKDEGGKLYDMMREYKNAAYVPCPQSDRHS